MYALVWLVIAVLFIFHASILFEYAWHSQRMFPWLLQHLGPRLTGKLVMLSCFIMLFFAHLMEAVVWGLLLWRLRLTSGFSEGLYFCATSMTSLGYGDVVLPTSWRLIGPLMAISGLLMFGCSTAFLFVVIQSVWKYVY